MDLLISALNNIRREMSFFEITATKYGLTLINDPPNPITRAYLDLFLSASSSCASLLEGMVVLWGTEHVSQNLPNLHLPPTQLNNPQCYRTAWLYASNFSNSLSTPSTDSHIVALHQALIPNWTSPAFSKFVDATRVLVDELANTTTSPNGKEEMLRCEEVFRQICWLEERFWPDVDGMGEEDESARLAGGAGGMSGVGVGQGGGMGSSGMSSGMGNSSMSSSSMGVGGVGVGVGVGEGHTPTVDGRGNFGALNGVIESTGQGS